MSVETIEKPQTEDVEAVKEVVNDLDVIDPVEATITINGVECRVKRIKAWDLIQIVRILSVGVGDKLGTIRFEGSDSDVAAQVTGLLLLAIPRSENEVKVLISNLVQPVDGSVDIRSYLSTELEPEELIDICTVMVEQEKGSFSELWGKVQAMWKKMTGS